MKFFWCSRCSAGRSWTTSGLAWPLLTDNGVELVTRIAGLLLAAIAVQLVANSAIAFAHNA